MHNKTRTKAAGAMPADAGAALPAYVAERPELYRKTRPEEKFVPAQVIAALESSGGVVLGAAQKLRCSQRTIQNYIDRYPDVAESQRWSRRALLDLAVSGIVKKVAEGNLDACKFVARTLGRDDGWSEKHLVTPPKEAVDLTMDWSKVPTEVLEFLREAYREQLQ